MGTDIHIHVEYLRRKKGKKPRWIHVNKDFEEYRNYQVFGILAGARSDIEPLFPPRGLPDDVSLETLRIHKDWEGDAHTESWLTTEEFGMCLNALEEIYKRRDPDDYQDEWLKEYRLVHKYMKDSDDEGEPARIIFWFDN